VSARLFGARGQPRHQALGHSGRAMFRGSLDSSGHESVFTRAAIGAGLRLDGRLLHEYRDVELSLYRGESKSSAEVQIGNTRVFCAVHGRIVAPFPDRPTDGLLQFNAHLSQGSEGMSHVEVVRLLERCIRESEAIDTESLCIVGGEKVWQISCEIRVLDYAGCVLDAAVLAAMGALRAFRKPEVSVVGKGSSTAGQLVIHSSDEREPLPLALHHTPLAVTIGIFKAVPQPDGRNKLVLMGDPCTSEERAMDGAVVLSINTHKELCAVYKPGGVSVPAEAVLEAAKMASQRAETLHAVLQAGLQVLEQNVEGDRRTRLEALRAARAETAAAEAAAAAAAAEGSMQVVDMKADDGGIDRDDPVLSWSMLHRAAVSE